MSALGQKQTYAAPNGTFALPPIAISITFAHDETTPSFGPRMVCTMCGAIGADSRPNWNERAITFRPERDLTIPRLNEYLTMCHQWLSIAGLAFDIVGFLMIAFEWHFMSQRENAERLNQIGADYERLGAELDGKKYQDPHEGDSTMRREFQKLWRADKRFRRRLFYPGVTLVVLGFVFQILGGWPYGLSALGINAC